MRVKHQKRLWCKSIYNRVFYDSPIVSFVGIVFCLYFFFGGGPCFNNVTFDNISVECYGTQTTVYRAPRHGRIVTLWQQYPWSLVIAASRYTVPLKDRNPLTHHTVGFEPTTLGLGRDQRLKPHPHPHHHHYPKVFQIDICKPKLVLISTVGCHFTIYLKDWKQNISRNLLLNEVRSKWKEETKRWGCVPSMSSQQHAQTIYNAIHAPRMHTYNGV